MEKTKKKTLKIEKSSPMLNTNAVLILIFSLSSVQADTKINAKDNFTCTVHYLFCFCFAFLSFGKRKGVSLYSNPVIKILGTFFQLYSQLIIALYIVEHYRSSTRKTLKQLQVYSQFNLDHCLSMSMLDKISHLLIK